MRSHIKSIFPHKNIGPADIRRIIPSIIFAEHLKTDKKGMDEILHNYAVLVNTSDAVLMKHYIRETTDYENERSIELIGNSLLKSKKSKYYLIFNFVLNKK